MFMFFIKFCLKVLKLNKLFEWKLWWILVKCCVGLFVRFIVKIRLWILLGCNNLFLLIFGVEIGKKSCRLVINWCSLCKLICWLIMCNLVFMVIMLLKYVYVISLCKFLLYCIKRCEEL